MLAEIFLKSAAMPAALVAVLFFLFGKAPEPWRARMQGFAIFLGFAIGCYMLTGFPPWPPTGGASSLVWVALWFAIFPWVVPQNSALRYGLRGVWVVVGVSISIWTLKDALLANRAHTQNVLALMLVGWATWSILERSVKSSHLLTPIALACLASTATSLLFVFKASALMSQMMTVFAVVTGGLAAIAWLFPSRISLHAVFPFLSGFFGVCLATGYVFLDINPWLLFAMAIPFAVLLFKDIARKRSGSALIEALISLVIAAIPLSWILYDVYKTAGPLY